MKAFKEIDENPNAYYYRFNAPGEAQRNGQWSKAEEKEFFERMKQVPVNSQWGIFSMTIPGRVGYQCSNFYRFLIKQGRIKDDNYFYDSKGKLCYRRGKNRDGPDSGTASAPPKKAPKKTPAPPKEKSENNEKGQRKKTKWK